MKSGFEIKNSYQKFLGSKSYSHFITIEINSRYKFSLEDVKRRLCAIEFKLNKTYLKSSFPKWDRNNRFWFVGTREGDGLAGTGHFHILLHAPTKFYRRSKGWFRVSFPTQFRRLWWQLSPPEYRPALHEQNKSKPIWIECVQSTEAAACYITKACSRLMDDDSLFFINP